MSWLDRASYWLARALHSPRDLEVRLELMDRTHREASHKLSNLATENDALIRLVRGMRGNSLLDERVRSDDH
jgi:hypothetical protein